MVPVDSACVLGANTGSLGDDDDGDPFGGGLAIGPNGDLPRSHQGQTKSFCGFHSIHRAGLGADADGAVQAKDYFRD